MAGNSLIGNLAVSLTMQTAAFQKGATIAEKRAQSMKKKIGGVASGLKGFGAALAGSLAVGAVTSAIDRGLEYASSLGEVAQQLGVTTGELQKYRFIATQVGLEQSEMDSSLAKLSRTMGEAQQGSKPLAEAFGRLGISVAQLKGKSADEAMKMIADGLKNVQDPAQRAAILVDLFGKSGQKLAPLLAGGSQGLNELGDAYKKLGLEISAESIAKADAAKDKMAALKQVLEARIAGVVAENSDAILKMVEALASFAVGAANAVAKLGEWGGAVVKAGASTRVAFDAMIAKIKGWAGAIVQAGVTTRAAVDSLIESMTQLWHRSVEAVSNMVKGVRSWVVDKLNGIWDSVKAKIKSVQDAFHNMYVSVVGASDVPDMVEGVGAEMARLDDEMVKPAEDATKRTAESFANLAQSVAGSLGSLISQIKSGDWLGALQSVIGLIQQVAPIFAGGGGAGGIFGSNPSGGAIGMAKGGSGIFGGVGGTDRNILSLNGSPIAKVSRGERFAVSPNNDNEGSRVMIVPSPYFDVVVDKRATGVAAPMARQAATAGSSNALSVLSRRQNRSIP